MIIIVLILLLLISTTGIEAYGQVPHLDRFYNYVQNQKYEEAFVLADSLKESSMADSIAFDYYYILGSLLYHTNNTDSAYCCFNKAIQSADRMNNFDLKYVDAMSILIDSYYKAEDYSQVAKKARSLCKKKIAFNYEYINGICANSRTSSCLWTIWISASNYNLWNSYIYKTICGRC